MDNTATVLWEVQGIHRAAKQVRALAILERVATVQKYIKRKNVVSNKFKLTQIELTTLKLTITIIIGLQLVCVCRVTDPRGRMLSSGCSQV